MVDANAATALGMEACRLGYTRCEGWLDEAIDLIWHNFQFCSRFIAENCPGVTCSRLEGTYLMWINCESLGLDDDALHQLLFKHDLYCNDGRFFSAGGERHIRINLAGPAKCWRPPCSGSRRPARRFCRNEHDHQGADLHRFPCLGRCSARRRFSSSRAP